MSTQPSATKSKIIRFKNVPVITTEQLAQFYGTETVRIRQNFDRNKERFIEGKHFYKIVGEDLREFKKAQSSSKILCKGSIPDLSRLVQKNARSLILWTERGAARHAKMLDTEHAWDVFEQLEDSYFNQAVNAPAKPAELPLGQNNVYLPNKVGKFFVENKADGTVIIRDANNVTVVRRRDMDVVKNDCQTIRLELELFLRQIEKMEKSLEVDGELLPLLGRINWRGI